MFRLNTRKKEEEYFKTYTETTPVTVKRGAEKCNRGTIEGGHRPSYKDERDKESGPCFGYLFYYLLSV